MADVAKAGTSILKRGWEWVKRFWKPAAVVGTAAVGATALSDVAGTVKDESKNIAGNVGSDLFTEEMDKRLKPITSMFDKFQEWLEEFFGKIVAGFMGFSVTGTGAGAASQVEAEAQREAKVVNTAEEIATTLQNHPTVESRFQEEQKAKEAKAKEEAAFQQRQAQRGYFSKKWHGFWHSAYNNVTNLWVKKEWADRFGTPMEAKDGAQKIDRMMDYFRGRGLSTEVSAGIVANLIVESGLDCDAKGDQNPKTKKYHAIGLAQWQGPRQRDFEARYGKKLSDANEGEQLDFIMYELTEGKERGAWNKLKKAKTAEQAARIFSKFYERPEDREGEADKRADMVKLVMAHDKIKQAPAGPVVAQKSAPQVVARGPGYSELRNPEAGAAPLASSNPSPQPTGGKKKPATTPVSVAFAEPPGSDG